MGDNYLINQKQISADAEICDDKITVAIDDNRFSAEYLGSAETKHTILINSKIENVYSCKTKDGVYIWHNGRQALVKRETARKGRSKNVVTQTDITPKTPGTVIKILVKEGDEVKKGQELIVISAMKMETPLFAGFDAVVKSVNTSEGANVMPGEIMIDLQPTEKKENE